jgi:hypothetical protein
MYRIAMILNDTVENIAAWDGLSAWQPAGYTLVDVTDQPQVDIGSAYDASTQSFITGASNAF